MSEITVNVAELGAKEHKSFKSIGFTIAQKPNPTKTEDKMKHLANVYLGKEFSKQNVRQEQMSKAMGWFLWVNNGENCEAEAKRWKTIIQNMNDAIEAETVKAKARLKALAKQETITAEQKESAIVEIEENRATEKAKVKQ